MFIAQRWTHERRPVKTAVSSKNALKYRYQQTILKNYKHTHIIQ